MGRGLGGHQITHLCLHGAVDGLVGPSQSVVEDLEDNDMIGDEVVGRFKRLVVPLAAVLVGTMGSFRSADLRKLDACLSPGTRPLSQLNLNVNYGGDLWVLEDLADVLGY